MPTKSNPQPAPDLLNLESKILRALCTTSPAPDSPSTRPNLHHASIRAAILATLHAHRWQNPEHRVVFEALILLPGRHSAELREQLPAQATRMGFPDVNWEEYFTERAENAPIEVLAAELLAASHEAKP
jgi:hypothetical protein